MEFREMPFLAFKRRDLARVQRNEEAKRVARIQAKDEKTPFDEDAWEAPEPEPDNVFMAGGNTVVIVERQKGDPPYTPEQMAEQVQAFLGQRDDQDALPGSVNYG